jgi:tetratricopeptide (TPR) repeat protein
MVDAAEAEYRASLEATPGYARGWLGLGEVSYQRGRGDLDCAPGSVDRGHLEESIRRYRRARTEPVSPAPAQVDLKATFGVGRSAACLSQAAVIDLWDEARQNFTEVIDAYESGASGLQEFASESYSLLGFVDLHNASSGDDRRRALEQSAELNIKAREATNDPIRIGVFSYLIADAYRQLGRRDESCRELQVALNAGNAAALANADTFDCE